MPRTTEAVSEVTANTSPLPPPPSTTLADQPRPNKAEKHVFDILFYFCTILDACIVRPILFVTAEENLIYLPFYNV